MREDRMWKLGLAVAFSLIVTLAGCGGGGGDTPAAVNNDTDGDSIPNAVDAFPNDAAKFVNNVTVLLAGLTPGAGGFSTATAVNNGGSVVGFSQNTTSQTKAVRWTVNAVDGSASAAVTLNPISVGGTYSAAYGINTAGITVGESESTAGGNFVAAYWPAGAATGTLATALPASATFTGTERSAAYGINNLATPQIVGEATTAAGVLRAVLWNGAAGAPVDLGILAGGTYSAAYAINANGLVVGEADTATGVTRAVAWLVNSAGVKTLGPVELSIIAVGDVRSVAFGVDSAGRVVGESENATGEVHAGMWTLNTTTLIPTAKSDLGPNGSAYAINDSNRIAGHLGTADLATVWDTRNTALPNSAVSETTLTQAFGLNDGNLVVGLSGTGTGARALVAVPR